MANGISIQRRKKLGGEVVWGLRVRRKGQFHSETFLTKTAAIKAGNKIAAAMDDGSYVPKGAIAEQITLSQALDRFLDQLPTETERQRTYKGDKKSHANQIKKFKFAKLPLSKIRKSHIREFRDRRSKECSANTVHNNLNTISKVFSHAISEWDISTLNPVKGIQKLPKSAPRNRRLADDEETMILTEAQKRTNQPWFAPLIEFLLATGMRLGEVSHISPDQVFLEKRQVYLEKTKTDFPRHVPLPARAVKVLTEFQPFWGHERVFHVTSNSASSVWLKFKNELLETGKLRQDLHLHDLRHEGISNLFEMTNHAGEPLLTVAHIRLITGHKDINTLVNVYANFPAETVVDAMAAGGY
ncbi:MAG: tyrosine-type recombinase/integrase [Rhodospirillaceae bacterium]